VTNSLEDLPYKDPRKEYTNDLPLFRINFVDVNNQEIYLAALGPNQLQPYKDNFNKLIEKGLIKKVGDRQDSETLKYAEPSFSLIDRKFNHYVQLPIYISEGRERIPDTLIKGFVTRAILPTK
jgi:hypothetical protein